MSLLHLDSVSAQRGARKLFHDLDLVIESKERLAIIGPNGSGKSTLLKILASQLEPDSGRLVRKSDTRVVLVEQSEEFLEGETVLSAALKRVENYLPDSEAQVAVSKELSRAGFQDFDAPAAGLSGGWRKRLSLCAGLASSPDLLLLDEPTNHLDFEGLKWLEDLLGSLSVPFVLVSHDRFFLEQTAKRVIEIAPYYEKGFFFAPGAYLEFKERREEFFEQEAKRTSSLANKTRRELEWARRSPKARTGKASYRMKEAKRLKTELSEAKSRGRREQTVTEFQSSSRLSKELLQLMKCSFAYGENQVLDKFSWTLVNKMCLGLLGANGEGKSTLLKLIAGELEPSAGKIKPITGLRIAYFDQLRKSLADAKTLGDLLGAGHDSVIYKDKPVHLITWGRRFGFEASDHEKPVTSLSGGEQARALLSLLVREEADLLLLDEPTNDLDIPMLEALENMILSFEGAVVLVTHDRYMLEEVCSHFLGFSGTGNLQEFASFGQWASSRSSSSVKSEKKESKEKPKSKQRRLSYKDQREYDKMEETILLAEEEFESLKEQVADPSAHTDLERSRELTVSLEDARLKVETLYARWEELENLRKGFESD